MKTGLLYSLTLAFLLASCTQDEQTGNMPKGGESVLNISSVLTEAGGRVQAKTSTRAADVLTTGSIGVFRSKGAGYAETQDNKQYTYTAAKGWQPSAAADTVYLMANNADVCAYFPYQSTYTDNTALPLASGKYTGTEDDLTKHDPADICYATNRTLNGASVSTDFEMQHAMAMVQLSFERLNYASTLCNLTEISIKNKELISTATLDIGTGTYAAPVKAAVKWTPGTATPATGIQVPSTGISKTTSALLVPCTLDAAGATTFSFTVDGQAMSVKVPAAKLPAFEAGKIHQLKFVIHAASITLSDVSIIDWVSEWDAAGEPNIDGTLNDYIELGGVKWALANLEYNATHHNYHFAPSATSGNTTLQWNALTPSEAGDKTATWDSDFDPCTRLEPKGTWTTPTKENFAALIALSKVWTDNYNGVNGQWFGTKDTDEAALHPDRYLFLPAVGSTTAGYWTRTYGTSNNPQSLRIAKGSVPTEENTVAYTTPLNVRCVKVAVEKKEFVELNGVKWAIGNLYQTADGAYHVAEKQGDFYHATISPVSKWAGYTQFFLFAYSSGDPAILPPADDQCRKVADGGWCIPTKEQHEALVNGPHVVGYFVNEGGYSVRGMYFGTANRTEAESHPNNYLFLPYTGRATLSYDLKNLTLVRVGETALYMNTYYYGAGLLSSLALGSWDDGDSLDKLFFYMDDKGESIRCVKATD